MAIKKGIYAASMSQWARGTGSVDDSVGEGEAQGMGMTRRRITDAGGEHIGRVPAPAAARCRHSHRCPPSRPRFYGKDCGKQSSCMSKQSSCMSKPST